MSKKKQSAEAKVCAVKQYLGGGSSQSQTAAAFQVSRAALQQWIVLYESMGEAAFLQTRCQKMPSHRKRQAAEEYLAGGGSQTEICRKYGIRSKSTLQTWIRKYNGQEKLKSSGTGGRADMTRGRKTTLEERVEIVRYCIAHERNYAETAEQYQISYQQARNYTIKYETSGIAGLEDRRGHRKPEEEWSELDRLRAENRILRAEKEYAEMEAALLKKVAEIERRRG